MKKLFAIILLLVGSAAFGQTYNYPDYRTNGGTCGPAGPPEYCGVANATDGTLTAVTADFSWVTTPRVVGQSTGATSVRFGTDTVQNFVVDQNRATNTETSAGLWQSAYGDNQPSSCSDATVTLVATNQLQLTATCSMAMNDGSTKDIVVNKVISNVLYHYHHLFQLDGGTVTIQGASSPEHAE